MQFSKTLLTAAVIAGSLNTVVAESSNSTNISAANSTDNSTAVSGADIGMTTFNNRAGILSLASVGLATVLFTM